MENKKLSNKFTKTLFSAVLVIVLALSMIGGATYALFTSTSSVNVAITSATVEVVATPKNMVVYSPTLINMDGTIQDATNLASGTTFANGGTATFTGNTLTLDRIAPGDKVTFDIDFGNQSNIKIKYRLKIEGKGQDFVDETGETKINDTLLSALTTTITEGGNDPVVYDKLRTYVSAWRELDPVESETAVSSLNVSIELPADKGNVYQNLKCSFKYSIEAVQSNTNTEDYVEQFGGTHGEAYVEQLAYVYTNTELQNEVAAVTAGQGKTLILGMELTPASLSADGYEIKDKNITIDLNGWTLKMNNAFGKCVGNLVGDASLTFKNGTIWAKRMVAHQSMFVIGDDEQIYDRVVEPSLTFENVTIDYNPTNEYNDGDSGQGSLIISRQNDYNTKANVTVKNSTFDIKGPMNNAVYLPNDGTRVFENCTIKGDRVSTSLFICAGDWTVTGGSYVGNKYEWGYEINEKPQNTQHSLLADSHSFWEGPFVMEGYEYGGSTTYNNGILDTGHQYGFGTGDAICIVNRYAVETYGATSGKVLSKLGNVTITDVALKIGTVSLADQSTALDGDVVSGPSGYGIRVYDVKAEGHPVLNISGVIVDNKTQTKKDTTTVTLPDIYVVTAPNSAVPQERMYNSYNGSISSTPVDSTMDTYPATAA